MVDLGNQSVSVTSIEDAGDLGALTAVIGSVGKLSEVVRAPEVRCGVTYGEMKQNLERMEGNFGGRAGCFRPTEG